MSDPTSGPDFRALFEGASSLFLVVAVDAPRYTIVAASDAYLHATMTRRELLVGRGIFEAFPDNPDDPAATGVDNVRSSIERALATRAPDTMAVVQYDIPRPESEGGGFEERYWSPVHTPVFAPSGEPLYVIQRVEDVTEYVRMSQREQRERERSATLEQRSRAMEQDILLRSRELAAANVHLREANDRMAELDRAKTAFFNNISHEFRTPLTLILGPLEDALGEHDGALRGDALEAVHRNAARLLRLVNGLLDFARIEAGRLTSSFVPTDLALLTAGLASAFQSLMDAAGVRLVVDCQPLPEPVFVDRAQWEKVVLNLVSNAFKFTLAGEIAVRLAASGNEVELSVADTGTGIPEHELSRVFERFHRVEGAKGRSFEGTGIGLALVQDLVKQHGGAIGVRSEVGQGSTFTVRIPRGKAHLPEAQVAAADPERDDRPAMEEAEAFEAMLWSRASPSHAATAASDGADDRQARLLVVDDNADMREYLYRLLSPHWRVELAFDGEEGLAAALRDPPDLVLSDVMMPRMDGIVMLRALRADPSTAMVPIVLLSARSGEESVATSLETGADDYLVKPFSARELVSRVGTHLELSRKRREVVQVAQELAETRASLLRDLEARNRELESFSYAVSHDLRAPLRHIEGFGRILVEDHAQALPPDARRCLDRMFEATRRMDELITDLLRLSRVSQAQLQVEDVDMTALARKVASTLREREPEREVEVRVADGMLAHGDARLMEIVLENLLGNAWKFTGRREGARIEVGVERDGTQDVFHVRDNGAGFDMAQARRLFAPFQRLHTDEEFRGTGIGLATVQRIVARHGGRVWATAAPGEGASFRFTLGQPNAITN